jgi:carbon-monoxide dehydrogenase large subunit
MDRAHPRSANALVGSPVERIEDLRFLKGRGQFVADLAPDGLLHAVILRSPVAHGRIRRIDVAGALTQPGVVAAFTAADIGRVPRITLRQELLEEFKRFQQPVIADGKVRYVGEPVAVVLAENAAQAEDALEAIHVEFESLPVVAGRAAARKDATLLFEDAGSNCAATLTALRGDADAAFRDAP